MTAFTQHQDRVRSGLAALALLLAPAQAATADKAVLLDTHNGYRAALGITPLTWSAALARSAQAWAEQLAAGNTFEHSDSAYGENLWAGTAGAYTQADMVTSWGDERRFYRHGVFPDVTSGGVVGHYTQIIWRHTERVGCGLASGGGRDVLVCHYDPAGNWIGQSPY